ncbi:hypothetical protein Ddc_22183 [Ditylenchus destructor]|nr:hypothetical protein Ddc_22183 [Ditylenchus destructor]
MSLSEYRLSDESKESDVFELYEFKNFGVDKLYEFCYQKIVLNRTYLLIGAVEAAAGVYAAVRGKFSLAIYFFGNAAQHVYYGPTGKPFYLWHYLTHAFIDYGTVLFMSPGFNFVGRNLSKIPLCSTLVGKGVAKFTQLSCQYPWLGSVVFKAAAKARASKIVASTSKMVVSTVRS